MTRVGGVDGSTGRNHHHPSHSQSHTPSTKLHKKKHTHTHTQNPQKTHRRERAAVDHRHPHRQRHPLRLGAAEAPDPTGRDLRGLLRLLLLPPRPRHRDEGGRRGGGGGGGLRREEGELVVVVVLLGVGAAHAGGGGGAGHAAVVGCGGLGLSGWMDGVVGRCQGLGLRKKNTRTRDRLAIYTEHININNIIYLYIYRYSILNEYAPGAREGLQGDERAVVALLHGHQLLVPPLLYDLALRCGVV